VGVCFEDLRKEDFLSTVCSVCRVLIISEEGKPPASAAAAKRGAEEDDCNVEGGTVAGSGKVERYCFDKRLCAESKKVKKKDEKEKNKNEKK